jgi:murein DD-endopeptidase MepM/ murein hydrolase activator NlpD
MGQCPNCSGPEHPWSKGEYLFPVRVESAAFLTHHSSPGHTGRNVCAVDLKVPVGTMVRAAREGTITSMKMGSERGGNRPSYNLYENWIEITHPDGETTLYGHLSNFSRFKIGTHVNAGQVFARSGATGWLAGEGPHLHFQVTRYHGKTDAIGQSLRIRWAHGVQLPEDREPITECRA